MAKVISQATFDQVVKDNIEEFEMDLTEAISDAGDQFTAQGVELSNIVKDMRVDEFGNLRHTVVDAVTSLLASIEDGSSACSLSALKTMQSECGKDLAHRLLAGANGGYTCLLRLCQRCSPHSDVSVSGEQGTLRESLQALCILLNGQPDLLDDEGSNFLVNIVAGGTDSETDAVATAAKAARLSCLLHEGNRQRFVDGGLVSAAASALRLYRTAPAVVREVCAMLRSLTLDDDIRVPFGKGHEHAKAIVTEAGAIELMLDIATGYSRDASVLGELLSTIGQLAVRNEFCQRIMDLGGLELMLGALHDHIDSKTIATQIVGVLKQVAGNDEVKISIIRAEGAALIVAAVDRHQGSAALCENACAALAALTLRSTGNAERVMASGGPYAVLQSMKTHGKTASVQKQGCMAIRNMIARNREYCDAILLLGAEDAIRKAAEEHKECADEGKAALRDLGCKVELRELWKGERGTLARD